MSAPGLPSLDRGQNFGAIRSAVTAGDLCINAADHAPRMIVPRHEHANAYLCVVMAGCLEVRGRKTIECPAGSVIAYPSGHVHSNRFSDERARCINIHLGPTWVRERWVRDWLDDCRHVRLGTRAHTIAHLAREIDARDSAAAIAAASAAIELLAHVMRAQAPCGRPAWLERIVEIIEADLANAPGLSSLAAEVGAHPAHVSRAFRRTYGETIGAYVRRRRVEEADRALAEGTLSLAEIAAAAGFSDQAHFTRVFRRHFGLPPGERRHRRSFRSNPA